MANSVNDKRSLLHAATANLTLDTLLPILNTKDEMLVTDWLESVIAQNFDTVTDLCCQLYHHSPQLFAWVHHLVWLYGYDRLAIELANRLWSNEIVECFQSRDEARLVQCVCSRKEANVLNCLRNMPEAMTWVSDTARKHGLTNLKYAIDMDRVYSNLL